MNYAGYYINLDRRPDNKAYIENELARYGLKDAYNRFSAADGNTLGVPNSKLKEGEMGCFTSHCLVLKENIGSGRHLHIIEDDVILASCTAQTLNWVIDQGHVDKYDIIYTDVLVPLLNDAYKAYKEFYDASVKRNAKGAIENVAFNMVDLKNLIYGSTSSFLINKNSVEKLYKLYFEEISNEPKQSIDLFIRKLNAQGVLRVGCLFPFVTSVRLDHIVQTDIAHSYHQMSALAVHLARYSFFIGADLKECQSYLDKFMPLPALDAHGKILNHLLAFSMTDNYRSF